MPEWYLYKEGTKYGPYTWEQMCQFAREGRVLAEDNVWKSGMPGWTPTREITGLLPRQEEQTPVDEDMPRFMPGGNGEELLGVIGNVSKKASRFNRKYYSLVVTSKQLIFAEATKKMMMDAIDKANEESKGKSISERMEASRNSQFLMHKRYYKMSLQEILGETPDNFSIPNSDVNSATFRYGRVKHGHKNEDSVVISTMGGNLNIKFHEQNMGETKKILWRALGNRVR